MHFGHIFVVLAILCLGPKGSAVAGILGLVIFDVLNAYMHAIPNVLVCTLIECLSVGNLFLLLKRRAEEKRSMPSNWWKVILTTRKDLQSFCPV